MVVTCVHGRWRVSRSVRRIYNAYWRRGYVPYPTFRNVAGGVDEILALRACRGEEDSGVEIERLRHLLISRLNLLGEEIITETVAQCVVEDGISRHLRQHRREEIVGVIRVAEIIREFVGIVPSVVDAVDEIEEIAFLDVTEWLRP